MGRSLCRLREGDMANPSGSPADGDGRKGIGARAKALVGHHLGFANEKIKAFWHRNSKYICWLVAAMAPATLLVDFYGMMGHGESRSSAARWSPDRTTYILPAEDRAFLLKEYETATNEIKMRLEHEHTMVALKFTLVGAV